MDLLITKENEPYFDIMNVHKYANSRVEPESFISFYKLLNVLMRKARMDKSVWVTETGASTYLNGGVSEEKQAIWLPRIFLISFACGIDKVFWYKSRSREIDRYELEDHYGLWHKDYTVKPSFYTYNTLTKMCPSGSSRPNLIRQNEVYIASWVKSDKKKVWAIWNTNGDRIIGLNIKGKYSSFDCYGNMITLSTGRNLITPSVVYIVGAKDVQISI